VATIAILLGLGLAAWALARAFAGYPPRDPARRVLAPRELALLAAAGDTVFPPAGPLPLSGCEAGIPAHVDHWLALMPRRNRLLVRLLLGFFEHATLLFPAPGGLSGLRRFSRLDLDQRAALLEAWGRSPLRVRRIVFTSLRTVLTSAYFASPGVLRATGLAPLAFETPVVDADLLYPRIGGRREEIAWRPEDRSPPGPRPPLDPHGPLHRGYEAGP
jgi:hypothetical protein